MKKQQNLKKIALISSYLPRQCGIGTFTHDLRLALSNQYKQSDCFVIALNDTISNYDYPDEVRFEMNEQDINRYQMAADYLNFNNIDMVCLQHEFGIFGGNEGSHILALLRNLNIPIVTTLHTILKEFNTNQINVLDELVRHSSKIVVMTETGKEILTKIYNTPDQKIEVIPHGIPDMPFVDPNFYKDQFGVEGKYVILTFGLLSPNKGIESVFKALPEIISFNPNVVYIVLGATHPNVLRISGESYRMSLERLAHDLGIKKHIIFYNRFVNIDELKEFLGTADIYITPYLNKAQITSGTLAYAFGCGKAVISTPYWHAEELLANNRGVLVPFNDSKAIAKAIINLLKDEPGRHAMRKNAYLMGREMVWNNIAHLYMKVFQNARMDYAEKYSRALSIKSMENKQRQLPRIRLTHLKNLTDSTGIFQHARFTIPRFEEGYCLDDNARAFLLTVLLEEIGKMDDDIEYLMKCYAAFISYSYNTEKNRFRNFMSFNRKWLEDVGSDDSQGRTLWALGTCVGRSNIQPIQMWATQLYEKALPMVTELKSPRSWAFSLLGINEYLKRMGGNRAANQIKEILVQKLVDLYTKNASENWPWFEDILSYNNAVLSHALLLCDLNSQGFQIGIRSLEWLIAIQTSEFGYFQPIGSEGWYPKNGNRAKFDQQPILTHDVLSACLQAFHVTGESLWYERAQIVFEWFLGRNDLGLSLYDSNSGGCYDALHIDRVNQNQGAESTLAFLLSLIEMYHIENTMKAYNKIKR